MSNSFVLSYVFCKLDSYRNQNRTQPKASYSICCKKYCIAFLTGESWDEMKPTFSFGFSLLQKKHGIPMTELGSR